eukprot:Skav202521  [mRNA]  locus=scaffold2011:18867:19419:- [translate_table: standard]
MMEPAYTLSEKQLRDFLAQLVEEGKLDFDGNCSLEDLPLEHPPVTPQSSVVLTDGKRTVLRRLLFLRAKEHRF